MPTNGKFYKPQAYIISKLHRKDMSSDVVVKKNYHLSNQVLTTGNIWEGKIAREREREDKVLWHLYNIVMKSHWNSVPMAFM